jgi:hypothetical protein
MKLDWVKTLVGVVQGTVVLFLLWAALVAACVIGVTIAIFTYHRDAVTSILGGIAAYYVIKEGFLFYVVEISWSGGRWGDGGEERRRIEAATGPRRPSTPGEEEVAARNRGTAARLAMPVAAVLVFFAYLIYK